MWKSCMSHRPEMSSLVGLKGCVKGFQFQKNLFNLLEEQGTIGISSGCPEESFVCSTPSCCHRLYLKSHTHRYFFALYSVYVCSSPDVLHLPCCHCHVTYQHLLQLHCWLCAVLSDAVNETTSFWLNKKSEMITGSRMYTNAISVSAVLTFTIYHYEYHYVCVM